MRRYIEMTQASKRPHTPHSAPSKTRSRSTPTFSSATLAPQSRTIVATRIAHVLASCIAVITVFATPASASDYSHTCSSADGLYETQDGKLYARADVTQTEIPYQPIAPERLLAERNGYCIAQGKKYEFQLKTYTLDVRITVGSEPRDLRLNCELAADGLPAAYRCEKEVVTVRNQPDYADPELVSPPAPATNLWLHNGSKLRLEATGNARRFLYVEPRRAMLEVGATPGGVVFEGTRTGSAYSGTAYVYSRQCGRTGYAVSGTVSEDDRVVRLTGNAPILADDCRPTSTKPDTLVFTFVDK
ncbi:MAG: hypothetical protein K2Y05_09545 [Hyphomicrobiaceae bacterium]|nr:hypothetical protein [Hyphomicrobiaceae bacterium]